MDKFIPLSTSNQGEYVTHDVKTECVSTGGTFGNEFEVKVAKKVLFVVRVERFIASITDGDIRRWILKKENLEAIVKEVANYNLKFIYEKDKMSVKRFPA